MTLKQQEKLFLAALSNTLSIKQVTAVLIEYEHAKDMRNTRRELVKDIVKDVERTTKSGDL